MTRLTEAEAAHAQSLLKAARETLEALDASETAELPIAPDDLEQMRQNAREVIRRVEEALTRDAQ